MTETTEAVPLADMLATGATYRQLDYWTSRGWLRPGCPSGGSGSHRRWTTRDRDVVTEMMRLIRFGFDTGRAAEYAIGVVDGGVDSYSEDGVTLTFVPQAMRETA